MCHVCPKTFSASSCQLSCHMPRKSFIAYTARFVGSVSTLLFRKRSLVIISKAFYRLNALILSLICLSVLEIPFTYYYSSYVFYFKLHSSLLNFNLCSPSAVAELLVYSQVSDQALADLCFCTVFFRPHDYV